MKTKIILLGCVLGIAGAAWSSPTINFASDGILGVKNEFDVLLPTDTDYMVRFYESASTAIVFDPLDLLANYTGTETGWNPGGTEAYAAGQTYIANLGAGTLVQNDYLYGVILNSSQTKYALLTSSAQLVDSSVAVTYIADGISGADWQAIPEPATLLIFGPGIAGLLGYRRRKQKLSDQLRDLFERRQESIEARKEAEGTERGQADYVTPLSKIFMKRDHKKVDLLGDLLLAIDSRFSK